MATPTSSDDLPLPKDWPTHVKSAIPQVASLAHLAIISSIAGAGPQTAQSPG